MINAEKNKRIRDLIVTLSKVKESRDDEYKERILLYTDMRDGGDGGPFRDSDTTIRDLHFKKWKDGDFQIILEALGETPVLSAEDRASRFEYENKKSFLEKVKNMFFRE